VNENGIRASLPASARGFDFARHKKWSANNHSLAAEAVLPMMQELAWLPRWVFSFLNEFGDNLLPIGDHLSEIKRLTQGGLTKEVSDCNITFIADVENPLFGESGRCLHICSAERSNTE